MSESPKNLENLAEKIPSMDKVLEGFDLFLKGAEITKKLKKVEDDQGLFIFDVEARLPTGEIVECLFKRAHVLPEVPFTKKSEVSPEKKVPSRINTVLYDSNETPSGTGPQYDYIDGAWVEETVVKRTPGQ